MKAIYRISFLAILGLLTLQTTGFSKEEFVKTIVKEYGAKSNTTLEIINKYGQIQVENWEKPSVKIEVKIVVDHSNNEDAQKLLSMITVDFTQEGDLIKAITQIEEGFGTSNYWHKMNGKNFKINFLVNAPKEINLKLSHKYGDIFINELSGLLEVDLKYGNININKLSRGDENPLNTIVLGYGKASVEQCNWLKVNASYSPDMSINTGKALILVTKYSKIRIDKTSSLVAESAYDGYRIGSLSNFVIEGKYSQYKVDNLSKKLDAEIKYGGIEVATIPESFQSIKTISSYSGVKLGISSKASYKINGYVRYGNAEFPDNENVSRIVENTSTTVKGNVGGGNPTSTVTFESSYGSVNLYGK